MNTKEKEKAIVEWYNENFVIEKLDEWEVDNTGIWDFFTHKKTNICIYFLMGEVSIGIDEYIRIDDTAAYRKVRDFLKKEKNKKDVDKLFEVIKEN